MTAKTSFGQWLKQRRKQLDLTREELAGRIGCSADTIYKIEADARRPSKQIAELLAAHLNIPHTERYAFVTFARSGALGIPPGMPWETPFHPPSNLPTPPTQLIGREEDVLAVQKRLSHSDTRLLTLVGSPGIGKTRLALEVATRALDDFADGVFFVALAPISDAKLVLTTITTTLGVPDAGPRTPFERLKTFLRDKQMLLLLDNFEQILAAAPDIAELLSTCLWLKLLVTSRAPLRIRPERQIPVSSLTVPDLTRLPDVETIGQSSAITLFMERAHAVKPDFALTEANAGIVAAICARLDGLPLAIELISARTKLLPPAALLERLSGRLLLQSDGLRDIEPRHRTLNNAIDWSYQLLSADEQTLFRRLGVFVGGWTLDAAEAVCTDDLHLNVIDGLASLLDKSLLKQEAMPDGEPHFTMLETIREYALEGLVASGELVDLRQRHTDYFLKLAQEAEAHQFGSQQIPWFDRLETELNNLRAALTWSHKTETGLRLAAAMGWFFTERSYWNEGFPWLERALAANPDAPSALRAKALHTAGVLAWFVANERASIYLEQAIALARTTHDRWNLAWALSHISFLTSDPALRVTRLEESLALFRELDDAMGITHNLVRCTFFALDQKDYTRVPVLLEEAEVRARQAGDQVILGWITLNMGYLAYEQDRNLIQAKALFKSSLTHFREARFQMGINRALIWLGMLELALGHVTEAQTHAEEALISPRDIEPGHPYLVNILVTLAGIAISRGQFERAVILLGASDIRDWIRGEPIWTGTNILTNILENKIEAVRAQLGETAFAAAWAEGRAMTFEQAVAYALEDITPFDTPPAAQVDDSDGT
jgi:predicted ATPase/transcriptional regulator with XRE-family HTH domain